MSEISKAYEPQSVEDKWYQFWLDQKCFVADAQSKKPAYSIVIPPPNITGMLHMGHVLNNTIQDILARKARMDGKEVLWLPGTDHASIATHMVLERKLKKEERITRYDLGREKFIERAWEWREKHGGIIISQLKKLGCSCDWSRLRFTMDEAYSHCVQKVFIELYKKGLVYRGKRMVNWCPASLTALSDEEVVMKEQKGSLYYFKVEVVEQASSLLDSGRQDVCPTFLTIATTRPETIPGDTAVAVNPKDPRYAKFIGKHVIRPLPAELPREQKLIPIIGDEHVDFEFGTGVLKVTPAHDKADFEIGQRHKLAQIDIMHPNGHMNELAGKDMNGLDRFKARKVAVEKLTELGALEKEEPYTNNVGFSERADVPIEPRLSEQWFLTYPSTEQARNCVAQTNNEMASGGKSLESHLSKEKLATQPAPNAEEQLPHNSTEFKMRFHPQRWAKVYDHWMGGIQDWCISRQLWWGHRIPVWTLPVSESHSEIFPQRNLLPKLEEYFKEFRLLDQVHIQIIGAQEGFPKYMAGQLNSPIYVEICTLTEDADRAVALLGKFDRLSFIQPISAEAEKEFPSKRALEIARDVAENFSTDRIKQDPDVLDTWFSSWLWPFATMGWPSQTDTLKKFYPTTDLVTGPDIIFFWVARMIMAGYEFMGDLPFRNVYFTGIIRDKQGRKMSKSLGNSPDPLDLIGKYGADALRFGTMRSAPLGQDILFDEQNVELGRNFCNKLWNACRFRQMVGGQGAAGVSPTDQTSSDRQNFRQDAGSTFEVQGEIDPKLLTSDDKWILLKLDAAIREMNTAFAEYKFSDATAALYRFFWSGYCDWYVEASKAVLGGTRVARVDSGVTPESSPDERASGATPDTTAGTAVPPIDEARKANTLAVIDFVLSHTLRLFHPFLPFITEELWHGMGYADDMPENQGGKTIMFAPWPKPLGDDFKSHYGLTDASEKLADAKYELVSLGRNLRREFNIQANRKIKFILKPAGEFSALDAEVLKLLLNAESVEIKSAFTPPKGTPMVSNALGELYLPLEGLVDAEAEKNRLKKEQDKITAEIAKVEQKLANPNFAQKVPANVLAEHQQRLADWQARLAQVKSALAALQN